MSDEEKLRMAAGAALRHVLNPNWACTRGDRDLRGNLISAGLLERYYVEGPEGGYWTVRLTPLGQSCCPAVDEDD